MNLGLISKLRFLVGSIILLRALQFFGPQGVHADAPAVPAGSPVATNAAPGGSFQQAGGLMGSVPFVLMFGVFYFLVLRPQQKKVKEQQEMISNLKHGDDIISNSGILGKVTGVTDKVVTVEVADQVRVRMLKSQVSQVVNGSIKDIAK